MGGILINSWRTWKRASFSVAALLTLVGCAKSPREVEPAEIWEMVSPSVVRVEATLLDGEQVQGSGFVCEVDGKKYILSNRHVVLGAKEIRVGHSQNKLTPAPGYRVSPKFDLTLIDIPHEVYLAPIKRRTTELRTGERVYVIGFPLGLNKSITQGIISSQTDQLAQFDAPISSGSSGGPLVDKDGLVIGVVMAGSVSSAREFAQNLNFAIKTSYIPKADTFKDPIVSFYDAWREIVDFEGKLIDFLQDQRAIELHEFLMNELGWAFTVSTAKDGPPNNVVEAFQKSQSELRQKIETKHGTVAQAAKTVASNLRAKISELETLPDLFIGIRDQGLLREFLLGTRSNGLFRAQVEVGEIAPLLKISLQHVQARYEDTAYRIEFLAENLSKIIDREPSFISKLKEYRAELDKLEGEPARDAIRVPYKTLLKDSSENAKIRLFFLTWAKLKTTKDPFQNYAPFGIPRPGQKLTADDAYAQFGKFETELIEMFQMLAEAALRGGSVEKAIGYMQNELSRRKYPSYDMAGFFAAGVGDFQNAYSCFEKEFNQSFERINPFTLENDGQAARYVLMTQAAKGENYYSHCPKEFSSIF